MASMNFDPDARLTDCPDVPVNTRQPAPLSSRLEELVRVANESGARTNRTELVGALLLSAPEEGKDLFDRVVLYRQALVKRASLKDGPMENVLEFHRHPRGPRKRSTG
jgi:hypothetical protein